MAAFIPPDKIQLINDRSDLLEVVQHYQGDLKKSGTSYKGKCPACGSGDSFTITPGKGIAKCFSCGLGKKGALSYLVEFHGMEFTEACKTLADRYNIDITPSTADQPAPLPRHNATGDYKDFRNAQLLASGIPDSAQKYTIDDDIECNRYDSGTIDHMGVIQPGYDMLLHYLDLDGKPIMYKHDKAKKVVPFIRTRYQFPDLHKDKNNKPIKYHTPPGAGNHLWIPERIRTAYQEKEKLPVLAFVEGEKKADAMCIAGIPAVGVAGIWNFSVENEMPGEIERLIRTCAIEKVVFFFDSDFDDIGKTIPTPIDTRVKGFFKAAINFKEYFENYRGEGLNIYSFIAHGIDPTHKGMDDLLVALRDQQQLDTLPDISDELRKAMSSHKGSDHIRAIDITVMHPYQLQQIWHIHSPVAFRNHYKDRLKDLPEFMHGGIKYIYNKETDAFEIKEGLQPEERYWRTRVNTKGYKELDFHHTGFIKFLANRGYGQIEIAPERYRMVHKAGKILSAVDSQKIDRFVIDFTESLEEPEVLEMIYRGGEQYIGPKRLSRLKQVEADFLRPMKDRQYMFFKDQYWEITRDKITPHKYTSLPGSIWSDDIIDFSPEYIPEFLTMDVTKKGDEQHISIDCKHADDSDIFRYFQCTSDIHWRTSPHSSDEEAKKKRADVLFAALADKIIATGYVLSNYMDPSLLKAIICMDALESENGRSEGGTGKSIWATMFEHCTPTQTISAKNPRLTEDQHLYEGVDDRTRVVVFDDCRRNLDFEAFLSDITRGITVNPKGLRKFFIGPRRLIFTTNHSIRGEDRSYVRRQYIIAFSDFFNLDRTPYSVFKRALFAEWDYKQFNFFYNLMASCLQQFMRHGLVSFAPTADIERRKLRDFISEPVLEFLENYFYHGSDFVNRRHDIEECIGYYVKANPSQRMYASRRYMVDRLKAFCKYAGFIYNPDTKGERMRDGSKDKYYFIIADDKYTGGYWKALGESTTFGKDISSSEPDISNTKTPF